MRTKCALTVSAQPGFIPSCLASRLLQARHSLFGTHGLRTAEVRYYHRLDRGNHVHRYSFVPAPLFHYFAMTLPYRDLRKCGPELIPVPAQAIQEAEARGCLCDELFVMWACERNARVLHHLMRLAGVPRPERQLLWQRMLRVKKAREAMQQ